MADRSTTPIDLPELSGTPATPGSGYHRFYAKTDGKPYSKSAAGTEYDLSPETTTSMGALLNGATSKTTPVDADQIGLMDSAASNVLKKLSWANLKATLKDYFDSLTTTLTNKTLTSPVINTGIELGHATDTTITRVSAGVIAVEGVNVLLNGGALGTPSSATLTNATGLPVSGITASTSTAIGVGSVELGHATDTTISRVSAGVIAVEGVTVPTLSSTSTLTNKTLTDAQVTVSTPTTLSEGYLGMPQNSQSAAYTLVITDAGKHILHPSADTTARTFTIPANSSVAFPIGTAVTFINQNAGGTITISITTDTMRLAGAGTTGSRTLAANGIATAVKVTSTEWLINGVNLT